MKALRPSLLLGATSLPPASPPYIDLAVEDEQLLQLFSVSSFGTTSGNHNSTNSVGETDVMLITPNIN